MKKRTKVSEKIIARQRIRQLFEEAETIFSKRPKLANKYVGLARKIAMKARIRIPKELKGKFCKHCYSFLRPGVNLRIRLTKSRVIYYCLECKKFMRFPYLREKKAKKK